MSILRRVLLVLVVPTAAVAQPLKQPPVPPQWLKPWTPPAVAKDYRSPNDIHKVMVERRGPQPIAVETVNALHYQGRTLLVVNSAGLQAALLRAGKFPVTLRDDLNLIRLRDRVIDTTVAPPPVPDAMKLVAKDQRQLHLVQFAGPVQPDWRTALLRMDGLDIVTYFPENAYLVWATPAARAQLASMQYVQPHVQWQGPFHPDYKIHPAFDRSFAGNVQATVQLYAHAGVDASIAAIRAKATSVLKEPRQSGVWMNMIVEVPASELEAIARLEDVVNIEPFTPDTIMDERQGQILAGNVNMAGTGPNAPGYLAWLNGLGFNANFGFTVDVTDDGFDRGQITAANVHPVFLDGLGASRVTYARSVVGTTVSAANANNIGGHGTINASIIAGLNQTASGAADFAYHGDTGGFRYGLGIAPFAFIGSTNRFAGLPDFTTIIDNAYNDGARISSNSWGNAASNGQYDAVSQEYDGLVRDGRPSTAPSGGAPGNQEMVVVFAAGNAGPGATTLGNRGSTSKNTITVAAGENFNATGDNDGCFALSGCCADVDADDMRQIIGFSSRGPTADGRVKPDIAAPGTHIFGAASQDPGFTGSSVCGGPNNDRMAPPTDAYYPADPNPGDMQAQNLYTWSSGTSHSTPAVSGGAALLRQWFLNHGQPPPSPAMTKAYLMNSATYMTGPADNLPSNNQGVGRMNLGTAFDNTPRLIFDQTKTAHSNAAMDASETLTVTGTVVDATKPFRVSLAYTDAPGTPGAGVITNNDLDLEVQVGGNTYKGNQNFNQGITGPAGMATADTLNNAESVFLPAGTTGPFTVTVRPSNINSDGVPNNGDATDQDFALVIYNAQFPPRNPVDTILVLDVSGSMNDVAPGGTLPKIELLKDAVEMFVRAWEPFSIPGDRMGIVYFSSGIAATVPAAAPLLLPFQTNANMFITDVRGRTAGGCTALGAGILTAANGFDAMPNHQQHIIIFTNGMQNRSPMVTESSPRQILADASAICGDSGVAGNPGVNIADYPVKAMHTIGVGAFGAEWTTLLAGIAGETGGLNHVTNAPDEDLEDFFLDNLVTTLRVDPVEKAATRTGTLAAGDNNKSESFEIDGTARKAEFAVSWRGDRRLGAVGYDLIAPDGTVLPRTLVTVREGPFYRVASVTFPIGAIPFAGTWKLRFHPHLQVASVTYRITLIVDEADIRYNFEVPTNTRGVGEPIPMSLWVMKGTKTVTGLQSVRATISRPPVGIGTFLSTHPVSQAALSQPVGLAGDQFVNLAAKKEFLLTQDNALRHQLDPITETIELFDDGRPEHGDAKAGDGVYSALYTNTQRPGTYRVAASFDAGGPELASVTRTEVRNVSVDMKRFDPSKSVVDIRAVDARTFDVTARLLDAFDNFWGPGRNVAVVVSPPGKKWGPAGRRVALTDNLDGSYSGRITLTPAEAQGGYDVLLTTGAGVFGKLSPPAAPSGGTSGAAGTWAWSLHGGVAWPTGAFNANYDSGPSVAVDVEYRLTPSLLAVGVVERDQFAGTSTSDFDWWSISPKLKYELGQSTTRPYIMTGAGAYIPSSGSTKLGLNAGLGVDYFWTPRWTVEIGAEGHRVMTSGSATTFFVTQLGLIHRW